MENNNIEYDAAIRATDTSAGMISFVPEGEKEKKKEKRRIEKIELELLLYPTSKAPLLLFSGT